MALIDCIECTKQISSESRFCVHCGHRKQTSIYSQNLGFDGQVFILIVTLGIIVFFLGGIVAGMGNFVVGIGIITGGFVLMFVGSLLLAIRSL